MTEAEIATKLIESLRDTEDEIWCEVPVSVMGETYRADIVTMRPHGWMRVIEVKKKLDESLITQIGRWQGHANEVWVAVENPAHTTKAHRYRSQRIRNLTAGMYYVGPALVSVVFQAASCTQPSKLIRNELCDSQKLSQAGVPGGKRVKKDLYDEVRRMFEEYPPMTGKEIAAYMKWAPGERVKFVALASAGRLPGIKCNRQDVPWTFYSEEE